MIDPNAPAFPHPEYVIEEKDKSCVYFPQAGLTIRATMAMHIMAATAANPAFQRERWQDHAAAACKATDALIAELNKTQKP